MGTIRKMEFESSITNLREINSSFDAAVLRICYTGENKNKSFIPKDVIERSLPSIYNCPIVCNYDRETDTFGGHDMQVVRGDDGALRLVNLTQPVGLVPESSKIWFENFEEKDGTVHEYLYAEVMLWKRQEAYRKIKNDGIAAHSMEINVLSGHDVDGIYHIDDFEFTAFAIIGVEPCYESSCIEVFSDADFKSSMFEMMRDFKTSFNGINFSKENDDIKQQTLSTEGGIETLETELKNKDNFALNNNIVEELVRTIKEEKVSDEWGEYSRYIYEDCDMDAKEVYCWDTSDWLLYGFSYMVNGDAVEIDSNSKKRKKYVVVDFDGAEQPSPIAEAFGLAKEKLSHFKDIEAKYSEATENIKKMDSEIVELRKFKADVENKRAHDERDELFSRFEDLAGIDAFENLRENCMDYDMESLEEKCFAIRGRNQKSVKFSAESNAPKIKVTKQEASDEPYGGLFVKYDTSK